MFNTLINTKPMTSGNNDEITTLADEDQAS
jgi:hypothetical protein